MSGQHDSWNRIESTFESTREARPCTASIGPRLRARRHGRRAVGGDNAAQEPSE